MKGKYISDFFKKPVIYLLDFAYGGKKYIKIGWTYDFQEQICTHFKELPGCVIYSIVNIDNPMVVEGYLKDLFDVFECKIDINGHVESELFTGLSIEEAEYHLMQLCDKYRLRQQDNKEYEKRLFQLEHERMKHKHELTKIAHEVEMKRIEMQILQLQLELQKQLQKNTN